MDEKFKKGLNDLNPKYVFVDNFENMAQEPDVFKAMRLILREYTALHRSVFKDLNKKRVIQITSSEFDPKINLENTKGMLSSWFPAAEFFISDDYWKLPVSTNHIIIPLEDSSQLEKVSKFKEYFSRYCNIQEEKILIICNSIKTANWIYDEIKEITNHKESPNFGLITHQMPLHRQIDEILDFDIISKSGAIVVSDEAISGVHFSNLQQVIQVESAQGVQMLSERFSRAEGIKFISLVENKDIEFYREMDGLRKGQLKINN